MYFDEFWEDISIEKARNCELDLIDFYLSDTAYATSNIKTPVYQVF